MDFLKRAVEVLFANGRGLLILEGLRNTALITIGAITIGIIIGTILAIFKVLPKKNIVNKALSFFADAYLAVFRGTPIIVQLALFYFVVFSGIGINPLYIAIIGFGFNSGAYVAEIMRAGILSVDRGQFEGGSALGLRYGKTMTKIILPQAIKNIVPSLGNEVIVLVKETSIASIVTVTDFFVACQYITSSSYDFKIPYIFAAIVYFVIVAMLTAMLRLIERRLRKSDTRN